MKSESSLFLGNLYKGPACFLDYKSGSEILKNKLLYL